MSHPSVPVLSSSAPGRIPFHEKISVSGQDTAPSVQFLPY
ncbi:hypothetical protein B4135_0269 [Caldibacillus debilis]|uniref:Uncharacterized protein n=1 Tax=Caldibacillus debilis TaxID=301148 RepID=A0A150MED7_9BACI|nr:hypothetical protein B4135_0269 [Caldibacillus debilis]